MRAMWGTLVSISRAGGRSSSGTTLRNQSFSSATGLTVPGFLASDGDGSAELAGLRGGGAGQHAGPGLRAGDRLAVRERRRPRAREAQRHPAEVVLARVTGRRLAPPEGHVGRVADELARRAVGLTVVHQLGHGAG